MSKFKITLKQHTPLIHFQASQSGATLRATELKPKLDKFLLKNVFESFEEYKEFLIGYKAGMKEDKFDKDKLALDYKVRIFNQINGSKPTDIEGFKINNKGKKVPVNFPLYFGNMGEVEKKKFIYCDTVEVEFFSFHKQLIYKIIEKLPVFLMLNNFGTRQSKGFGSFFINENNEYYHNDKKLKYDTELIKDIRRLKYKFSVDIGNTNNKLDSYRKVFQKIEDLYKSMRSGDPFIKLYFKEKNILWDKDMIKQKYGTKNEKTEDEAMLVKDLFGLSINEEWKKQRWYITKEHKCDSKEQKIERFKSPVFFKPIQVSENKYDIYFECIEIDYRFLGQEFIIRNHGKNELILKTPNEFNFDEFFKFVISQRCNKKVFPIYKEIKENLKKVVK